MKNKILVAGGAGFMGSYFISYMMQQYPYLEIVNIDNFSYQQDKTDRLSHFERYTFVEGDITDMVFVEDMIKKYQIELIINFAAETRIEQSLSQPSPMIYNNIIGITNILEVSRIYHIPVIYMSSAEVLGSEYTGFALESQALSPSNPYAASKAAGDMLCQAYAKTYDMPIVITRSCNIMGPYEYPNTDLPQMITAVLMGKNISLYGDGLQSREWMYIEDHSRAIDAIIQKGVYDGSIYHIGTGFEMTYLELAQHMMKKLDIHNSIDYIPDFKGHDRRYALDSQKIRALGWKPVFDLDTSIRKTLEWYRNNQSWWQPLIGKQ